MPETLTEEQLFDLEMRPSRFRRLENRHEVGLTPDERDALCRSLRAAWAANQQIIEVVDDTNKQIQSLKSENAALRAQLAQVEKEWDYWRTRAAEADKAAEKWYHERY